MNFNYLIDKVEIWDDWRKNYNHYVPLFIEEASNKNTWQDWDSDVFREFFLQSSGQCVSSLKQGYFTQIEKEKIKNNWQELAPLFKRIAESQDEPLFHVYQDIKTIIRKYTTQNRKAATNRLIASLQPQLLCTIINEDKLINFIYLLNKNIEDCNIQASGNWFENSFAVWKYYKEQKPAINPYDLMTLPWQTYETFLGTDINNNEMSESTLQNETIELLKYKKQIILQGPPGTGKTLLAKEIAREMVNLSTISKADIVSVIKPGMTIYSCYDKIEYKIQGIEGENIKLLNGEKNSATTSLDQVRNNLSKKVWERDKIKSEGNSYGAAIAKHIFDHLPLEQVKIIQFHPSYTYEDFVRGIVAESKGEKIEYRNVNKILGKFADEARLNWENSKKDTSEISKENKLNEYFNQFIDFLNEELQQKGHIELTPSVNIADIEDEAFRYKGNSGWAELGNRMLFKDIKRAYLDNNKNRQDIKQNTNLSGMAHQHATYYLKALDIFKNYISTQKLTFDHLVSEKVELKNYIIIIDEINRANLSSVLGELIYALEYRGEKVDCIYDIEGDNQITLPPNLYIIGTMNKADRSVAHIDYAIRRRFAFVDILPKDLSEELGSKFNKNLFDKVEKLFTDHLSPEFDANEVRLGHSYFIDKSDEGGNISLRLKYEIIPILKEYVKDGILKATAIDIINTL